MYMMLLELSAAIQARLHPEAGQRNAEVTLSYAATTMSDLIGHAAAGVLLITSLNNAQLARIAELMDVPGICLTDGSQPCPELLHLARAADTAIVVSPHSFSETSRRVQSCLGSSKAACP
jgi:hypothetical protein